MSNSSLKTSLHDQSLIFGLFLILVVFAFALSIYLSVFNDGLSAVSGDWGAFGSFFGGVLGPMVSLVTLLAVLKTVYLQRDFLIEQKQEFSNLNEHQRIAAEKQNQHLQLAKLELESGKISAYLSLQLKFIDTMMDHYRREADGMAEAIFKIIDLEEGTFAEKMKTADPALKTKELAENKITLLIALAVKLSMFEHESIESIRAICSREFLIIMHKENL